MLCDFPSTRASIPFPFLFDLIPSIQPRAFSIASSMEVRRVVCGMCVCVCVCVYVCAYVCVVCGCACVCAGLCWYLILSLHMQAHLGRIEILMAVVKYQTKLRKPRKVVQLN